MMVEFLWNVDPGGGGQRRWRRSAVLTYVQIIRRGGGVSYITEMNFVSSVAEISDHSSA